MTSDMVAAVPTPPGAGIFSTSGSTPGAAIAPGDLGMPGLAPPPAGPSADPRLSDARAGSAGCRR